MSKERELLKRWLAGEANQIPTHVPLLIETQNLLAQPEAIAPPKREPLSEDAIWDNLPENPMGCAAFIRGIKFAEKHHNIGE